MGDATQAVPYFPDWGPLVREATNVAVNRLVVGLGDQFEAFSSTLLAMLVPLDQALRAAPPWVVLSFIAAIAWLASRRLVFTLVSAAAMWLVGALGQWDQAMQTLALVLMSVAVSVLLGLPLGVWCARTRWVRGLTWPLMDLMQTLPSFVYLIPAAMLFGLGKVPAILATVVYAAPPLVRLTDLGLRQVPVEAIEAARVFSATRWQLLVKVQMPLALPSIMQGLNQTAMMALAMVVVASMIGARGVGETVLIGLQRNDPGTGLVGGLVIVILAIWLDRLLQVGGRRWAGAAAREQPENTSWSQ